MVNLFKSTSRTVLFMSLLGASYANALYVPNYQPSFWNDGILGAVQPKNNCYNYSTNVKTNTFA